MLRQGKQFIAIEAKAGRRFKPEMLAGLQAITALPGVTRRILVYGGDDSWRTDDRIEVQSADTFVKVVAQGL